MRKKRWTVYASIGGVSVVGLSSLLYLYGAARPSPIMSEQKRDVIYPVQYSDAHITENATTTDPRFKNLAILATESFLANAAGPLQKKPQAPEAPRREKGTWLWTPTLDLTPAYWDAIFAGARRNGIGAVYLSLDSYLDIFVLPAGAEKEKKKKAFDDVLEHFIAAAHKNNIAVDAEAGWRNWAEPGNEYKAFAVVDYVLQFNATHADTFRGLQYDIEPYLLESYATDKKTVLRNFIGLVDKTVLWLQNSDLEFSVVIPDFYDGAGGETPRFFYGWSYRHALGHLLRVLERRPGSTLLVMAYRNFSRGTDGSIDISKDEIRLADAYHTKVVVAQETGEVRYAYTSFYNTSLSYLNTQVGHIQETFAGHASYNGIAIHYANALMALE